MPSPLEGLEAAVDRIAGQTRFLLHLPVRGNGDGGVYSTLADISSLWSALLGGRIVSSELVTTRHDPRATP